MRESILFTIREHRTLPKDTWDRFVDTARRAGSTPQAVLRTLIERYVEEHAHDSTQPKADRPE